VEGVSCGQGPVPDRDTCRRAARSPSWRRPGCSAPAARRRMHSTLQASAASPARSGETSWGERGPRPNNGLEAQRTGAAREARGGRRHRERAQAARAGLAMAERRTAATARARRNTPWRPYAPGPGFRTPQGAKCGRSHAAE